MVKILVFVTSLFLGVMHVSNFWASIVAVREDPSFLADDPRRRGCLLGWRAHNVLIAASCLAGAIIVWFNPVVGAILGLWPFALYVVMGLGLVITGGWREIAAGLRRGRQGKR